MGSRNSTSSRKKSGQTLKRWRTMTACCSLSNDSFETVLADALALGKPESNLKPTSPLSELKGGSSEIASLDSTFSSPNIKKLDNSLSKTKSSIEDATETSVTPRAFASIHKSDRFPRHFAGDALEPSVREDFIDLVDETLGRYSFSH